MIVTSIKINKCKGCGKLCGYIIEKNNGKVPVVCPCMLGEEMETSVFSIGNDKFSWTGGSLYKNDLGQTIRKQKNPNPYQL